MKLLNIHKLPDPILRIECFEVEEVKPLDIDLFDNMVYTMKSNNGIGLAAPQVGIAKQFIIAQDENGKIIRLANPKIIKIKGQDVMVEGCLSVPDQTVEIKRPYEVVVVGLDDRNKEIEIKARGLLARVLQHEIDHLKGRLIVDYKGGD